MKGRKIWIRSLALFLVLTFLIPNIGFERSVTVLAADGDTYTDYGLFSNNKEISGDITMSRNGKAEISVALKRDPSNPSSIQIEGWSIENNNNVSGNIIGFDGVDPSNPTTPTGRSVVVNALAPGRATLILSFRLSDNHFYQLRCSIVVPFDIDTDTASFPVNAQKDMLIMNTTGNTDDNYLDLYTLTSKITGVSLNHDTDLIRWETSNINVATVDKGIVKSVGAGYAKITGTSTTDDSVKGSVNVLVIPTATKEGSAISKDGVVMSAGQSITTSSNMVDYLKWKILDVYTNAETDLLKMDTNNQALKDLVVSSQTKAGKYYIKLYAGSPIDGNTTSENEILRNKNPEDPTVNVNRYPATYKLFIPIKFNNETNNNGVMETNLVMSVGDVFNIEENSNIRSQEHILATNDAQPPSNAIESDVITYRKGDITAVGIGNTTVELHMMSSSSVYDQYYWATSFAPLIHRVNIEVVDGIKLNTSKADIYVKGQLQLTYTVASGSGPVTWKSSDPSIATVDNGLVTGIKTGTATITASYRDKKGVTKIATCIINVKEAVSGIKIDPETLEVLMGKSELVTAKIEPSNLTNTDLKWTSSDEKIATVEAIDGSLKATVTGVKAGTVVITAINRDNVVVGYCAVTVNAEITGIKLSDNEKTVNLGDKTFRLTAELTPTGASNNEIVWESTDTKVATVSNGLVTLVGAGKTTILASSKSNPNIKDFCNVIVNVSVTGLTLESTSKIMYVGEKAKVGHTVLPTSAANKTVVWTSTSPSVATVDANGNVTPVSVGQTVLIAKTADGGYTQTCTIYVKQEAKTIQLTVKDITINKGEDYQLEYTFDKENITDVKLAWSSTNPTVATVNDKGIVSGLQKGSTIIMVKIPNGETAYCNVVVKEAVEGIKLNYTKKTLYLGNTFTLKAALEPDGASNASVTWSSSDDKIATVSANGKVKGIKAGTAIITATSNEGGYVANCIVTVEEYVTKVKLNKTSYKLAYKKSYTLKATIETKNTTNKKLQWTSSNPKVVSVNSSGKITGKKYGTATITVKALDGSGAKATCKVQVVRPVTKVKLSKSNITMLTGKMTKLTATITPKNASIKSVTWSSDNKSVATVLSNGTIQAKSPGVAIITAKAKDNSGKSAYCIVTVKDPVAASSITIMTQNPVLIAGESFVMQRSVMPSNNTDKVTWASDNSAVASINKTTGKISAKRAGSANITAVTQSGKIATTTVTVIGLSRTSLTLSQYEDYTLYVEGMATGITWDITNPSVAVVKNGKVSSKSPGTATITATVKGRRLSCRLTVTEIR